MRDTCGANEARDRVTLETMLVDDASFRSPVTSHVVPRQGDHGGDSRVKVDVFDNFHHAGEAQDASAAAVVHPSAEVRS